MAWYWVVSIFLGVLLEGVALGLWFAKMDGYW